MKYFNVCTKKEFEQNGEKKESWYRAGYIKMTENGGRFLRLFHAPETTFYVFDQEEKDEVQEIN